MLEPGVRVGPFCVVGPRRAARARARVLDSHVVIDGDTRVGERNRFFPFSSIGLVPQDLKYRGEADAASRSATATSSARAPRCTGAPRAAGA